MLLRTHVSGLIPDCHRNHLSNMVPDNAFTLVLFFLMLCFTLLQVADQRLVGELQMLATHVDKEATKLIVVFMQDPVVSSECIPVTDMFMKAIMLFASRWVQITPAAIGSARYAMPLVSNLPQEH